MSGTDRKYRTEHVATSPRGWKVRSVTQGDHVVRIAFPPGRREAGSGHVVEILHPVHENPGYCPGKTRMTNPAELVLMTANPIIEKNRTGVGPGAWVHTPGRSETYRVIEMQGAPRGRRYLLEGPYPSKARVWTRTGNVYLTADPRTQQSNPRSTFGMTAREAERETAKHDRVAARLAKRYPYFAIRWHTGNISQAFGSRDEAEHILSRFHGAGEIIRVNPMPATAGRPAASERYRNPIGAEAAAAREIREGFTDSGSRGYRMADEPHIPAGDYAELGTSGYVTDGHQRAEAYLAVKPTKGGHRLQLVLARPGITFLSDTSRRQIWIAGRYEMPDQEVAQFTDDRRSSVNLGECVGIGYIAVKYHPEIENHAAGKRILWEHEFGEETHVCPYLIYDRERKRLSLEGGEYRVDDAGIIN